MKIFNNRFNKFQFYNIEGNVIFFDFLRIYGNNMHSLLLAIVQDSFIVILVVLIFKLKVKFS